MEQFARAGITMNCQVVSCPGINDGPALDRTLRELGGLYPAVNSVAVVPVGVTRFREGLCPIAPYTPAQAAEVIGQVERFADAFRREHGTALAWCSDEFYLIAGRDLPEKGYYEDLAQLENGVGMLRLLQGQAALGVPVIPVEADSGFDLVDAILGLTVELPAYRLPPEAEYYRYNP